jgi:hypothetical protein
MNSTNSATGVVEEVLSILRRLLEQAHEVEADVGAMPGADEALTQAIVETERILIRLKAN